MQQFVDDRTVCAMRDELSDRGDWQQRRALGAKAFEVVATEVSPHLRAWSSDLIVSSSRRDSTSGSTTYPRSWIVSTVVTLENYSSWLVSSRVQYRLRIAHRCRPDNSRRDAILDAALACFLRDSVAGTTIDDIKAKSGASVGASTPLRSKEGIAAELYLDILGAYHELSSALTASSTAREGIAGSVRLHLRGVATSTIEPGYSPLSRAEHHRLGFAVRDLNKVFYARRHSGSSVT